MEHLAPRRALLVYAVMAVVFVSYRVLEYAGRSPASLSSWLDDVLVVPLALGLALGLHRWRERRPGWTLPPGQVLIAVIFFTVVFEVLLPLVSSRTVADPMDAAAYAAGGVLFHLELNRPAAADGGKDRA